MRFMGILNGKLQFLRSRRLILKMKTLSIISVIVMLSLRMYLKKRCTKLLFIKGGFRSNGWYWSHHSIKSITSNMFRSIAVFTWKTIELICKVTGTTLLTFVQLCFLFPIRNNSIHSNAVFYVTLLYFFLKYFWKRAVFWGFGKWNLSFGNLIKSQNWDCTL